MTIKVDSIKCCVEMCLYRKGRRFQQLFLFVRQLVLRMPISFVPYTTPVDNRIVTSGSFGFDE